MKPLEKVKIKWSSDLAYAIGLLVTDGSLSKDGRHISFTSKDLEMVENLLRILKISNKIGMKGNGASPVKRYYVLQFGDIVFYYFLEQIGLMPNKTKIIGAIKIPKRYFVDFLRGHFDGDGSFYSYFDPRWKSSLMFYTSFVSASKNHIEWLRKSINKFYGVSGSLTKGKKYTCYQLKYAKKESVELLKKMYHNKDAAKLNRKYLKIKQLFGRIGINL